MQKFFSQKVDRRSKKAMLDYVQGHFRYDGLYAHRVKIHHLGLGREVEAKAFELLSTDETWRDFAWYVLESFQEDTPGWTIVQNGRSGGYLQLMACSWEDTGHKSRCTNCGQLNFKSVAPKMESREEQIIADEILRNNGCWLSHVYLGQSAIQALDMSDDAKLEIITRLKNTLKDSTSTNKCGRCGEEARVNLTTPIRRQRFHTSESKFHDFGDWDLNALRNHVELVQRFDQACDEIRDALINFLSDHEVFEEEIMVPQKVKVVRQIAA